MTVFIRTLDGSLLRAGAIDRIHIAPGFVPVSAGGDGYTTHDMIYGDQHGLGIAAPGQDPRKLMEHLATTVCASGATGVFAIKDGAVTRL